MNLFWLVEKDLRVTVRDPKTAFLTLFAPLIIMVLVGSIFFSEVGVPGSALSNVVVGACNLDEGVHGSTLLSEMDNVLRIENASDDACVPRMDSAISEGRLTAYVVIPQNFSRSLDEGNHVSVLVKADNAKHDVSSIAVSVMEAMVYSASQRVGREFVVATWSTLSNMSSGLSDLGTELDAASVDIGEIGGRLSNVTAEIQGIDTVSLKAEIIRARRSLSNLSDGVSGLSAEINSSVSDIDELDSKMGEIRSVSDNLTAGVAVLRGDLRSLRSDVNSTYYDAFCDDAAAFEGVNDTFVQRWVRICDDLYSMNASLAVLDSDLENQSAYLSALSNESASTQERLVEVRGNVSVLQQRLTSLYELEGLNNSLSLMEKTADRFIEVQSSTEQSLSNISSLLLGIRGGVDGLKEDSLRAKDTLDFLVSRDPRNVITPLSLERSFLFEGIRYVDTLFPALLAVILMFVTILFSGVTLIRERQAGTLKRVLLAPVSPLSFVAGKVVLVLVIALVQAVVLLLVGLLFFGLRINWFIVPSSFVVIAMISVTFSSLGMVVASLSDSENTALLASLVLCIPMLFLSGVFFPRELMIAPVRVLSFLSPLTHGVILLEQFLIYSIDPVSTGVSFLALFAWTAASLFLSIRAVSRYKL
ncbi:MAG: ABC transporter permease [Candidatus Diapherotrites archaeon]|nr:ABC transporter permease [Candidatus Diapherotrites archaeon]